MSNTIPFIVESYISYKQQLGFQFTAESWYLRSFAKYTVESGYDGHLTRKIVFEWCESGDSPSQVTKGRRFEPIKGLADYAHAFDKGSELLPRLPYGNPHKRVSPHIYTLDETRLLMDRCKSLHSPDGIRALTVRTAIGLLWSTGLRTFELVNLTVDDVDFENELLVIKSSKFNKDRLVPLLPDVVNILRSYREQVNELSKGNLDKSAFFVTTGGKPLNSRALQYAFQNIRESIDVSDSGYKHARLYDFRHTFATRTIRSWMEKGLDVNTKLFLLSTYMGHIHPEDTYWYISSTPELLELSSGIYEDVFGGSNHE